MPYSCSAIPRTSDRLWQPRREPDDRKLLLGSRLWQHRPAKQENDAILTCQVKRVMINRPTPSIHSAILVEKEGRRQELSAKPLQLIPACEICAAPVCETSSENSHLQNLRSRPSASPALCISACETCAATVCLLVEKDTVQHGTAQRERRHTTWGTAPAGRNVWECC